MRVQVRALRHVGRWYFAPLLVTHTAAAWGSLASVVALVLELDTVPGADTSGETVPALEMPRHLRAGDEWKAWGVLPSKVLGLADVTVQAGDFARCLVIEETGGHKLPDGTKADVRRFFAPKVGEVLALVLAGGRWVPALELEAVGAYPATTTTMQPAPLSPPKTPKP